MQGFMICLALWERRVPQDDVTEVRRVWTSTERKARMLNTLIQTPFKVRAADIQEDAQAQLRHALYVAHGPFADW